MSNSNTKNEIASILTKITTQYSEIENTTSLSDDMVKNFLENVSDLHKQAIVLEYVNMVEEVIENPGESTISEIIVEEEVAVEEEPAQVPVVKEVEEPVAPEPEKKEELIPEEESVLESAKVMLEEIVSDKVLPKMVVGLNDKFVFISNLFQGVGADYESALEQINATQSMEESQEVLKVITSKYNWDVENGVVMKFIKISEKRIA